ncbi:hypothetical protein AOQ84DRAFT_374183 [Glonium stellatum]|uniref:Uncharacterized protein n=1 Tax=Glonium stellatum TaxID=574774 RepID=A0A8E2F629_9PEZI|nr:hypothetical protein AOQ84DRAFT_374183 [Glonium stellatum]
MSLAVSHSVMARMKSSFSIMTLINNTTSLATNLMSTASRYRRGSAGGKLSVSTQSSKLRNWLSHATPSRRGVCSESALLQSSSLCRHSIQPQQLFSVDYDFNLLRPFMEFDGPLTECRWKVMILARIPVTLFVNNFG